MSGNHIINNRNSTPDATSASLRPPSSRNAGTGHHLRASADMSGLTSSPLSARSIRPASEMLYNQTPQTQNFDAMDKAAEQWLADIEQCENTLEEMATATTDQDFKAELTAIEEWFRVLSEAERTASLYALLQQATKVQILFFIQTLEEMLRKHPVPGILSTTKVGDLENAQKLDTSRNSMGRPLPSPANKRNSAFDPSAIHAMFPDAAAAIAKKKAEYSQQTGNAPPSNRNSTALADRSSLVAPAIAEPKDSHKDNFVQPTSSPWGQRSSESRPKSSSGQQPMGQFSQSSGAGSRAPRPLQLSGSSNVQSTSINAPENAVEMPLLSPYNIGNASWASMSNTPMQPNFNTPQAATQADMVANATAMKLAAMSTVNNRVMLDDARKYRRARSNDGQGDSAQMPLSPSFPQNVVVVNESGQLLNTQPLSAQQIAAIQAQQQAAFTTQRGRPESPGIGLTGTNFANLNFASPQSNGFLAAYDASGNLSTNVAALNLGQLNLPHGGAHEGYLSDHSDMVRGRSPRGRRGTSKPPEDPTDISLLQDIPAWLRSLRLHKYTDNLKDLKWEDLVELDHKGLEDRGVNALGARNKMLKVFEQVKEARTDGKLQQ